MKENNKKIIININFDKLLLKKFRELWKKHVKADNLVQQKTNFKNNKSAVDQINDEDSNINQINDDDWSEIFLDNIIVINMVLNYLNYVKKEDL